MTKEHQLWYGKLLFSKMQRKLCALSIIGFVTCIVLTYWVVQEYRFDVLQRSPLRPAKLKNRSSCISLDRVSTLPQNDTDKKEQKDQDIMNCNGIHNLSCMEPYYSRLHHVEKQCQKKEPTSYKLCSTHYKFSDKLKLVMCETPKAASTTMQSCLLKMDSSYKQKETKQCSGPGNNCFLELTEEEAWKRVKTYTSFLITRHPFERLVSAYFEKFVYSTNDYFPVMHGKAAARKQASQYLHGIEPSTRLLEMNATDIKLLPKFKQLNTKQKTEVLEYIEVMKTGRISFKQFIRVLVDHYVDGSISEMDRHWRPQVLICQPCAFRYSYIMKFDELKTDSDRLFDYLEQYSLSSPLKENVRIKKRTGFTARENITEKSFREIPENHLRILRLIYEDDFIFYNYNPYLFH